MEATIIGQIAEIEPNENSEKISSTPRKVLFKKELFWYITALVNSLHFM
jgi:hypothetical protein